jgi:glucokinase
MPDTRTTASSRSGYGLAVILTLLGGGVFVGGVLVGPTLDAQNPAKFRSRVGEQARHERLLADLRDVHDRAENVRLMVAAHRSAKTLDQLGGHRRRRPRARSRSLRGRP